MRPSFFYYTIKRLNFSFFLFLLLLLWKTNNKTRLFVKSFFFFFKEERWNWKKKKKPCFIGTVCIINLYLFNYISFFFSGNYFFFFMRFRNDSKFYLFGVRIFAHTHTHVRTSPFSLYPKEDSSLFLFFFLVRIDQSFIECYFNFYYDDIEKRRKKNQFKV